MTNHVSRYYQYRRGFLKKKERKKERKKEKNEKLTKSKRERVDNERSQSVIRVVSSRILGPEQHKRFRLIS